MYLEQLLDIGAYISMSTPGQPTENALAERFFKTVKWEEVYMHLYQTFEETQESLQMFLEDVYNAKCLHSSLDYLPLNEFELKYAMCSCLGGLEFLGALQCLLLSVTLSNCKRNPLNPHEKL
jgi:putative transposase